MEGVSHKEVYESIVCVCVCVCVCVVVVGCCGGVAVTCVWQGVCVLWCV